MLSFEKDHAIIPMGRKFATVVDEPRLREVTFRGQPDCFMHFLARGQSGELIDCVGSHERARRATHEMNIGDRVVIDESVKIIAIENSLEYIHTGYFICIDPRP